jgi:hypothetical protein
MNRLTAERPAIDKATRVGCVRWIILDDFSLQHGEKDFIKRQLISHCFFIRMVTDADPIGAYCLDYIVNIDVRLSLSVLKQRRPNATRQLLPEAGAQRTLEAVSCTPLFGCV